MCEIDHLAEISDDPDDEGSDYGRGWRDGYAAGFRAASQPTSNQPVAGELVGLRMVGEGGDHG
jgi:hypothetical protein